MQYRELGKTGLQVSTLAFGGSSLGGVFRSVEKSEAIRSVHAALDLGINLFDTAPYYGATRAESVLGEALRGVQRESFYLATKVGRYGPDPEDFDFTANRVLRSVDESLARLGLDYVDFIQVHDMEFGDIRQIIHETLPALRKVQQSGKARFIGITGLPVRLFPLVMAEAEVDQIQSYCHYCLNDTALSSVFPMLREKQVGVFNSAPLAMRLLSDEGPPDWHPAPQEVRDKCAEAARFCREKRASLGELALQFSMAHPDIHTTIVGTASPARVKENVRTAMTPPDPELLADVRKILESIHDRTWPSGRPENHP